MKLFFRTVTISLLALLMTAPVNATQGLADPTRPGKFVAQNEAGEISLSEQFQLHSVLISSQRRVAIINDKSVEEGDQVDGATVKRIDKNHVDLVKNGARFTVVLNENDFKQRK